MADNSFEEIVSELPFPVAFRCRFIMTQADKRSALEGIIDAYESLLRFLALVVISDYLRGNIEEPSIDDRLKKLFSTKISPGHWVEILREILKIYAKSPGEIYMPELLEFYFAGKRMTLEGRKFEEWSRRRNEFRGHAKRLITKSLVKEKWQRWWPEFRELIGQFAFLTSYEMINPTFIQRGSIKKAQICSGPDHFFLFKDQYDLSLSIKGVEPEESLLLVDKRNRIRQLLLYPFMVVRAPAEFYLFERGERRKGNLQRVVFASLGPGDALEIKRADQGTRIVEDLENKLRRLGEIGVSLDDLPIETAYEKQEALQFQEAYKISPRWAESGFPYHMVEGISDKLIAQIRHPQENTKVEDDLVLGFLLIAALHHGGNWYFWVKKNVDNPQVLDHLLRVLSISYSRPRFRALFALQSLEGVDTKKFVDERKELMPPDIKKIITRYVVPGKVADYLVKIKEEADPELGKRASDVLREISQYSAITIDDDNSSGLPVI